jgi:hypothetical protein
VFDATFFLNLSFYFGGSKKFIIIRNTRYVVLIHFVKVKVVQLFDSQIDRCFVNDSFNPVIKALMKIISESQ